MVLIEDGTIRIEVPCGRDGSFEPLFTPTHEQRIASFDDKIVAMYARRLGLRYSVLCVPTGSTQGDLYDERHQDHQRAATRDLIKTQGHFPADEAATKLI